MFYWWDIISSNIRKDGNGKHETLLQKWKVGIDFKQIQMIHINVMMMMY